jgi:hypothetical protein
MTKRLEVFLNAKLREKQAHVAESADNILRNQVTSRYYNPAK